MSQTQLFKGLDCPPTARLEIRKPDRCATLLAVMKLLLLLPLLAMTCSSKSIECPVKETIAYSRATLRGAPGPDTEPLLVSYFLYVVLEKGSVPSATGVWIQGNFHAATLRRVESPVEVDHDTAVPTGQKDTLVEKTADDVYQVELGEERSWSPRDDTAASLIRDNQAVVFLQVGQAICHAPAKEIKPLRPDPGM